MSTFLPCFLSLVGTVVSRWHVGNPRPLASINYNDLAHTWTKKFLKLLSTVKYQITGITDKTMANNGKVQSRKHISIMIRHFCARPGPQHMWNGHRHQITLLWPAEAAPPSADTRVAPDDINKKPSLGICDKGELRQKKGTAKICELTNWHTVRLRNGRNGKKCQKLTGNGGESSSSSSCVLSSQIMADLAA